MTKAELIKLLENLNDNAIISITDAEQNNCYDISEVRICEDKTSEYYNKYADIVVEL